MKFAERLSRQHSPVVSSRGVVATTQVLAVAAGLEILSKGGNAADAAIATAAALNVTEPTSTGLGGDCFALYYNTENGEITALNGSGRAPRTLSLDRLQKEGFSNELPPFHPYTITTPGACAGWFDLIARHGSMSMEDILDPAIRLAEDGFPVSPITARQWKNGVEKQLKHAKGGKELTINGRAPEPGEIFRNPGLARTLRTIAQGGAQAFYQGAIAEAIASTVQATGGCLSLKDLAEHHSTWEKPISTTYRGLRIWECPPNGQGLAALLALNILEGFDLAALPPLSVERLHLEIESMRLAFADTRWYVTDPEFFNIPLSELLSKTYASQRRKLINPKRANLDQHHGTPTGGSDTVYLSVVDTTGNACSFINSNYMGFGTGIVPTGWGFTLQNRGHNFSLNPEHPNAVGPAKRPYHTITPALATLAESNVQGNEVKEDLFACFGVMGGFMQPQGHLQVVISFWDDHLDPQAALDQPRFCITTGEAGGLVALEDGFQSSTRASLEKLGHKIVLDNSREKPFFGYGQVIVREPGSGVLWAGSDQRADGCAMTY